MTKGHQRWFILLIVLPLAYVGLRVSKQLRHEASSLWPVALVAVALLVAGTAVALTLLRGNSAQGENGADPPHDDDP